MPRKRKPPKLGKFIRRHGPGFRAVVTFGGKRHKPGPTLPTEAEAEKWRDQYLAGLSQPPERALPPTLGDALKLITDDLEHTAARAATFDFYENHARPLIAGLGGSDVFLHAITATALRAYVDSRLDAGVGAATIVGKELFVLRRMRKLALAAGYTLPVDPFANLRLPRFRTGRFDFMTRDRIAEVVAAMRARPRGKGAWHADLVELLFATGLRRAELSRLRVSDIDFAAGRILVDGKTGIRYQPFGASLEPVLRRLIAKAQKDGHIVSSFRVVEKALERWQKRLNEPRLMPHVLRHSYASAMASRVDPFELMTLMGHKSLTQTSRYYHARGAAIRSALDGLQLGLPAPEQSQQQPE